MPVRKPAALALLLPSLAVGCYGLRAGDPFAEVHLITETDTAATSTSDDGAVDPPLTTGTVTGLTASSAATSDPTGDATDTADPVDAPPKVLLFTREPASIHQAAPVVLDAVFTSDVVAVDILDNGEVIASVAPLDFPYQRMITSDKLNGQHAFQLVAHDDAAQTAASEELFVDVDLPPSGTFMWITSVADAGPAVATAIVPYQGGAILGGYVASGGVYGPRVRHVDAGGAVLWTIGPTDGISAVSALALRPDGTVIVVGNRQNGGSFSMWMMAINGLGQTVVHLRESISGEWGAAASSDAFGNIYVAGYAYNPNTPGKYDAKLWAFDPDGDVRWQQTWDNPQSEVPGMSPDQALGVATTASGAVVIAGETLLKKDVLIDGVVQKKEFTRAFAQGYSSVGSPGAVWVDDLWPEQSGARAIHADPKGGLVVVGWTRDKPESDALAVAFHLDDDLALTWKQAELVPFAGDAIAEGGGASLEAHVVLGTTLTQGDASEIRLSALVGGDGAALWSKTFAGPNGVARLHDLVVDGCGYIYFAGASDVAHGAQMLAGRLHP